MSNEDHKYQKTLVGDTNLWGYQPAQLKCALSISLNVLQLKNVLNKVPMEIYARTINILLLQRWMMSFHFFIRGYYFFVLAETQQQVNILKVTIRLQFL